MNPLFLLVDDDDLFLYSLAKSLERRKLQSVQTHTADDAISFVDTVQFTHAIIDLNLGAGQETGFTVLQHLVATQPQCQPLILTGFSSIATTVEAMRIGAVQYLPKPATVDEIITAFSYSDKQPMVTIPDYSPSPKKIEWEYIQRIMLKNNGNVSASARELGMHRRTLQRKLTKSPPRR